MAFKTIPDKIPVRILKMIIKPINRIFRVRLSKRNESTATKSILCILKVIPAPNIKFTLVH